jgi:hypothetical protein
MAKVEQQRRHLEDHLSRLRRRDPADGCIASLLDAVDLFGFLIAPIPDLIDAL